MRALRREHSGPLHFAGVGGPSMQAEGLHSLFPMEELSVMGFAEVLPRLLSLRSRLHQSLAAVRELRPSVVLGIDSKAFCLRLLRALADERREKARGSSSAGRGSTRGPALIQYVAPSAWAFRDADQRAARLAETGLDELLLLLPFEAVRADVPSEPQTRGSALGLRLTHVRVP